MDLDISKLSEDDLMDLNRRVIERLQVLRSAKSLAQLARFSVGMDVKFDTDDGRTITGTVARLNQRPFWSDRNRLFRRNSFGPNRFAIGSSRQVSSSK